MYWFIGVIVLIVIAVVVGMALDSKRMKKKPCDNCEPKPIDEPVECPDCLPPAPEPPCMCAVLTLFPTNLLGYDQTKFCGATQYIRAVADCECAKFEWFVERKGQVVPAVKYGTDDSIFYHRRPTDNAIVNKWSIGDYVICRVQGKEERVKIL